MITSKIYKFNLTPYTQSSCNAPTRQSLCCFRKQTAQLFFNLHLLLQSTHRLYLLSPAQFKSSAISLFHILQMATNLKPLYILPFLLTYLITIHAQCRTNCRLSICSQKAEGTPFPRTGLRQRIPPRDEPMDGVICRGSTIFSSVKFREALVRPLSDVRAPFVRISKYAPAGLTEPFSRRYFKPVDALRIGSAPSRGRHEGNQAEFSNDLCVRIPLGKWKELDDDGTPHSTQFVKSQLPEDCISLITVGHTLLITLTYDSPFEYDMVVLEPGIPPNELPFVLSAVTPLSPNGGIFSSVKTNLPVVPCRTPKPAPFRDDNRKVAIYRSGTSTPPRGVYHVLIIKGHDCVDQKISFRINWLRGMSVDVVEGIKVRRTGFKVGDTVGVARFFYR